MKFCTNCGEQLQDGNRFCSHCGTPVNAGQSSDSTKNIAQPQTFQKLEYIVNLCKSKTWSEGGKLYIDAENVTFKPHALNIELFSVAQRTIAIKDIIGYEKEWPLFLSIYVNGRDKYMISTYSKDEIVRNLEVRRRAYFESRGMSAPIVTVK